MKNTTKVAEQLNYKRSVISDGTSIFSVSSYEDFSLGRRLFAVYDTKGKRVEPELEKKLIEAKVENPLFIPREEE